MNVFLKEKMLFKQTKFHKCTDVLTLQMVCVPNSFVYTCQGFCYKSVHSFRVTCLFSGQYNTKGYGTVADVI